MPSSAASDVVCVGKLEIVQLVELPPLLIGTLSCLICFHTTSMSNAEPPLTVQASLSPRGGKTADSWCNRIASSVTCSALSLSSSSTSPWPHPAVA